MSLQIAGKLPIVGATGDVLTITAPTAPAFIRIKNMFISVSATSTVEFKSGANVIGAALLGTGNAYNMADIREGILDCEPGATFVIGNSAGTIRGHVCYEVVGGG